MQKLFGKGILLLLTLLVILNITKGQVDEETILREGKGVINDFYRRYTKKEVDLVFVLDRSASIPRHGWSSMITFVRLFLEHFTIDGDSTRVAVVTFGSQASLEINDLNNERGNKCSLMAKIKQRLELKVPAGYTATYMALKIAQQVLATSRPTAKKAVFVLTDGKSNIGKAPIRASLEIRFLKWHPLWNETISGPQVEIYAFGIKDAYLPELLSIASPLPNHTFFIPTFSMFSSLARLLHEGKQQETWRVSGERSQCSSACAAEAVCACGTRIGQYQCICKRGYSGDGLSCTPCPRGFYKDQLLPGQCLPCPPNSSTTIPGASFISQCACHAPYYRLSSSDPCKLWQCEDLPEIPHGHTFHVKGKIKNEMADTGEPCKNSPGDACHYVCDKGYRLTSHPAHVCQPNGTWEPFDMVTKCKVVDCRKLEDIAEKVSNGEILYLNGTTTYGSMVRVTCNPGWQAFGDTLRICDQHGVWTGTRTWCVEAQCQQLMDIVGGKITPVGCSREIQLPGQVCSYSCNHGYMLSGVSVIMCGQHGHWNATEGTVCQDIEPPKHDGCDMMEVTTGSDGLAVVHWKTNQPVFSDNSGYVDVSHTWTFHNSPARLHVGVHVIKYVARDQAGNNATCIQQIRVVNNTIRTVYCPGNIIVSDVKGSQADVTWPEPIFVDKNDQPVDFHCSRINGSLFLVGMHSILCQPQGGLASSSRCSFTVELKRKECIPPRQPKNGVAACLATKNYLQLCRIMCDVDYDFYQPPKNMYTCDLNGVWNFPDGEKSWPDCSRKKVPGFALMNGEAEYYFTGDCSQAKEAITHSFRTMVSEFMKHLSMCSNVSCEVTDIVVYCDLLGRRKRIATTRSYWDTTTVPGNSVRVNEHVTRISFMLRSFVNTTKVSEAHQFTASATLFQLRAYLWENFGAHFGQLSNITGVTLTTKLLEFNDISFGNLCETGQVEKKSNRLFVCVNCPVGTYQASNNTTCESCPMGEYQDQEAQLKCKKCPVGTSTLYRRTSSQEDCKAVCQAGSFSSTGFEPCELCDVGYFDSHNSSTECLRCPEGTNTPGKGTKNRESCKVLCPPGSYNASTGLVPCLPCPLHSYQTQEGARSCVSCPPKYQTPGLGSLSVDDCIELDHCLNATQPACENGGTCLNQFENYSCECLPGFSGASCQENVDECESKPCYNNGTCQDGVNEFRCICPLSFTGSHCEQQLDRCLSAPCQNGGSCKSFLHGFECYCRRQFSGLQCELPIDDYCSNQPCLHGHCDNLEYGYKCSCDAGYTGVYCDVMIDMCVPDPCVNGGHCTPIPNSFNCSCPPGYTGQRCEQDTDECSNRTCVNNGVCLNLPADFHCLCPGGYGGTTCDRQISADFDLVFAQQSMTDFARVRMFPNQTAISVCFGMRTTDVSSLGTLFSYRAQNEAGAAYDDSYRKVKFTEFTLYDYGKLQLVVNGQTAPTSLSINNGMWQYLCVSWKSGGGKWKIYINGTLSASGSGLASGSRLQPGGYLVLGQKHSEGFILMGSAFVGEITRFNVYSHFLTVNEVKTLVENSTSNTTFGDVVAWTSISSHVHGDVFVRNVSRYLDMNECLFPDVFQCAPNRDCVDLHRGFDCSNCSYGYQGPDCQQAINECSLQVCHNGASCHDGPDPHDYVCTCSSNFTGPQCDETLDPCPIPDPCEPQRICIPQKQGFYCRYKTSGTKESGGVMSGCSPNPCLNSGLCVGEMGNVQCVCRKGFLGLRCETVSDHCMTSQCINDTCQSDLNCIDTIYNPDCQLSPCLNNGTCTSDLNSIFGYSCQCPSYPSVNWDANCGFPNPCDKAPCENYGTCLHFGNNSFNCICPHPYTGLKCTVNMAVNTTMDVANLTSFSTSTLTVSSNALCSNVLCQHGGTCVMTTNGFQCRCALGFKGEYCQQQKDKEKRKFHSTVQLLILVPSGQGLSSFKAAFRKEIHELYLELLKKGILQVNILKIRRDKSKNVTMIDFEMVYTEFMDVDLKPLTTKDIQSVMERGLLQARLGKFSATLQGFSFSEDKAKHHSKSMVGKVIFTLLGIASFAGVSVLAFLLYSGRLCKHRHKTLNILNINNGDIALNPINNPAYNSSQNSVDADSIYDEVSESTYAVAEDIENIKNSLKMEFNSEKVEAQEGQECGAADSGYYLPDLEKDSREMLFKDKPGMVNQGYDTSEYMIPCPWIDSNEGFPRSPDYLQLSREREPPDLPPLPSRKKTSHRLF